MTLTLSKSLVFVGLMGAGKSAVGSLVAQRLGVDFKDSDAEISAAANLTIPEIFEKFGEAVFREKETQVIQRLLEGEPFVLSTGGGAYLKEENREIIQKQAVTVWLKADLDLLWKRVKHRNTRPLLQVENPYDVLKNLHVERTPIYSMADIVVESEEGLSLSDMCSKVIGVLEQEGILA